MQEYVESYVFLQFVTDNFDVDLQSLGVEIPTILTGLADLIGELRRFILDLLRKSDFERAEKYMEMMEKLYSELSTFYFPDKIVPGLRNKVDGARWTIERTKSDYIAAKVAAFIKNQTGSIH